MSFSFKNIQTQNTVEETFYKLTKGGYISNNSNGSNTSFDGLLSYSSAGPVSFTALNTNTEDETPTSNLNLLIGSTVTDSTGAYFQFGYSIDSGLPQTEIYTPGNLLLRTSDDEVVVSGTLSSEYVNAKNSMSIGVYPDNGSLTFDEVSLLQATSIIPSATFDPSSLTIDQNNGFIWSVDYTFKIIYKIDSANNKVVDQTSLSSFTAPIDLTWSSSSNSVWVITNEGALATQSSLIRINCDDASILNSWSLNSLIGNGHANSIIHDNDGNLWLMMGSYTQRKIYKIDITDPNNPSAMTNISISNGGSYYGGFYMDTSSTHIYAIANVGFGSPSVLVKILLSSPYTITYKILSFDGIDYYPANGVVYDSENNYIWIAVSRSGISSNLGYNRVIALDSSNNLVQSVPLPNRPNDLTIGGNAIWSANSDNTLSKIKLDDFTVSAVLEVGYLSAFILWSNYSNNVWVSSRRGSSNGNIVVARPIPVVNHSGNGRLLTSDEYGNFMKGQSDLVFENTTNTLTLGPDTRSLIPKSGLNNLIVSAQDVFPEINAVCFQSNSTSVNPSVVNNFSRGTISEPEVVQSGDVLGQYISRGMATGTSGLAFMNTSMINFVSDYNGAASNCVGGLIDFRTRGNSNNSNLGSYGYSRATIANDGKITFKTSSGSTGYIFPQTKPTDGQILTSNGSDGNLVWQSGVWQSYTPTITSTTAITSTVSYSKYTVIGKTCIGNLNCNISNIVSPTGASSSISFSLPLTGVANNLVAGSGVLTINSGASYPSQNISLVSKISNYNSGGSGPALCSLWYTANNGTSTDRQTYLENDYLPTTFGDSVTWNGYSGGVDISFNFSYEIQ
jgi:hypothetical protein